jgi:hypothetical protein
MQWLYDPNHGNADNRNNRSREASRYFSKQHKKYLQAKIDEIETDCKIKNIRDLYREINEFKKGYQPRTNTVKDEKGYVVADSHCILLK